MRKHICFVALHQEVGKTAQRNLFLRIENASASMPSWSRRFKAYFNLLECSREKPRTIKIDHCLTWLREHKFAPVSSEKDTLQTNRWEYSALMLCAADEFIEITYDFDLKKPRLRFLDEFVYD